VDKARLEQLSIDQLKDEAQQAHLPMAGDKKSLIEALYNLLTFLKMKKRKWVVRMSFRPPAARKARETTLNSLIGQ